MSEAYRIIIIEQMSAPNDLHNTKLTSILGECAQYFSEKQKLDNDGDSLMEQISPDKEVIKKHKFKPDEEDKEDSDEFVDNYDFLAQSSLLQSQTKPPQGEQPKGNTFGILSMPKLGAEDLDPLSSYLSINAPPQQLSPPLQPTDDQEEDLLTKACQRMKFQITSFNLPDPGNLRSSKKKDVRLRLKCLNAMLRQREKDVEYRSQYDLKLTRALQDREMWEEKCTRAQQRVIELDKEKYALQSTVKQREQDVKNTQDQQRQMSKNVTTASSQLEQKVTKLQCELKKREGEITKLQDQLRRLMGFDKLYYLNSIESTQKAIQGQAVQRAVPEHEFIQTVQQTKTLQKLQQENENLKGCLLLIQTELKDCMDTQLACFQALQNSTLFSEIRDRYQFKRSVNSLSLNLPQTTASIQQTCNLAIENSKKIKAFMSEVYNPQGIAVLVNEINQWIQDSIRLKNVESQAPGSILTLNDFKKFIKQTKCTCEFSNLQSNPLQVHQLVPEQRQPHFQQVEEQISQPALQQQKSTSVNRKKWGGPSVSPHNNQQSAQIGAFSQIVRQNQHNAGQ
ncbi:hypothetical protein FGO68_gene13387 [Halteria grandinella]|uniref:Uncharacterized protein n=1 Tax=Halteria grandinella TaxID=5974 RepID=A0A8J8NSU2_HALGN|nr:hypothetical protein FGO68_gene13387 [Halteria grandinella]